MNLLAKTVLSFLSMTIMLAEPAGAETKKTDMNLPEKIGAWTRTGSVRRVDSKNIFEFMNGAGELYLAYRFDHLDVYEYKADKKVAIQVEIYFMKTSDDAFGLLSLDWGGEPTEIDSSNPGGATIAPPEVALYGMGLLRMRMENIYIRIVSMRETPETRDAILSLGRILAAGRSYVPEPALLKVLSLPPDSEWKLSRNRIGWFRSHLVLNSLYYISHQNILDLDHSVEAAAAPFEKKQASGDKRMQFIMINYASGDQCGKALARFHEAYLPEYEMKSQPDGTAATGFYSLEDGWLRYRREGKRLGLLFECPDEDTARNFLSQISFHP